MCPPCNPCAGSKRAYTLSKTERDTCGVWATTRPPLCAAALEGLGLTDDQFIDMCILCGCDYCPSIKGIGPKTALSLLQKHGDMEAVVKVLLHWLLAQQ